jgi:glycosyltransferase involved in cell wall biosynthesis
MIADNRIPQVTCIMPTWNRRAFVPQAIAYFLRQDYPNKELLILDDGTDSVGDLIPQDERIRYIRLAHKASTGSKRNLACKEADGSIIAHWDDDDWMSSTRLSYQVSNLLAAKADMCGTNRLYFFDPASDRAWEYVYRAGGKPWLAGGTLCYTRAFWQANPFPDISVGEDARFVWSNPSMKLLALEDTSFYVALVHPHNTSPKRTTDSSWHPLPTGQIRALIGEDIGFYQSAPSKPAQQGDTQMKLNLGCCDSTLTGFVNVDIVPAPDVEVADLSLPWPWPDNSVDHVRAWDIIEHLPDKILTMNELWRVLKPGGTAEIAVPTTDGTGAFQDPTHVSFWNRRSFLYYEAGNPYRERFANHYGIKARFRTIRERVELSLDGPRLTIELQAVKL